MISTSELEAGYTSNYFYTGSDSAMTFWIGERRDQRLESSYPRSDFARLTATGACTTGASPPGPPRSTRPSP